MDAMERDYHDYSSDFNDRIEDLEELFFEEKEESQPIEFEEEFYRHLEEY
ncbi:hypothetical protein [Ekhidna sp.]